MTSYLLGIDHKVAAIAAREAVYWQRRRITEFLASLDARARALSTCNRFEIYGVAGDAVKAKYVVEELRKRFAPLFNLSYAVYGADVFTYLCRLAAGLESRIEGELEISKQLEKWASADNFPEWLEGLVRDALLTGSRIRKTRGLDRPEKNIAVFLYEEMLWRHDPDYPLDIAVAGTGKVAELFASYKPEGARIHFAAHKNILRAEELAKKAGGDALSLKGLPVLLGNADIFVSATSSPHRVFDKKFFSKIVPLRKKELYIYDLAMPRDVVPDVRDICGITLKNIDEVLSNVNFKIGNEAQQVGR